MQALPAPTTQIDALPYIDTQYNDPAVQKQVDELVQSEMRSFKPKDYLSRWPVYEPDFDAHPLLHSEWLRVCEQQPMPRLDTSRYQLDPPPSEKQTDVAAWQRSVDNAQAQLEHQANRLINLELLQKHGANAWRAHLNAMETSSKRLAAEHAEIQAEIDAVNRKRKLDQVQAGPMLTQLEGEWVSAVKKNLEIESQCLQLEKECVLLKEQVAARQA